MDVTGIDVEHLDGEELVRQLEAAGYSELRVRLAAPEGTPVLIVDGQTSPGVAITEQSRSKIERIVGESATAVRDRRATATAAASSARDRRASTIAVARAKAKAGDTAGALNDVLTLLEAG